MSVDTSLPLKGVKDEGGQGKPITAFKDDNAIPLWAKSSIAWAVGKGIVAGMPDGTFRPN